MRISRERSGLYDGNQGDSNKRPFAKRCHGGIKENPTRTALIYVVPAVVFCFVPNTSEPKTRSSVEAAWTLVSLPPASCNSDIPATATRYSRFNVPLRQIRLRDNM